MATSSNQPPRYSLSRANPQTTTAGPAFTTPAFPNNPKNAQRLEAERLDKERRMREEQQRMEVAGQNSLAELSEEQREEIGEAVCIPTFLLFVWSLGLCWVILC